MSDDDGSDGSESGEAHVTQETLKLFKIFVDKLKIDLDDPVETLGDLKELEELDLSDKALSELPAELLLAVPPSLRTLALEKNQLSQLPDGIAAFSHITELYLRENQLTSLPAAIGKLVKLESLYLEDNQITATGIPDEIASLVDALVGLCLHRNLLTVSLGPFDIKESLQEMRLTLSLSYLCVTLLCLCRACRRASANSYCSRSST